MQAVGSWSEISRVADREAPVIDHRPDYIVPGMIDLHVHTTLPGDGREAHRCYGELSHETLLLIAVRNAGAALRAGLTTLRDCGGRTALVVGLRDAIAAGLVVGPRVFVAGPPLTIPRGHCHYMGGEVEGVEAVRLRARSLLRGDGVDFLKMMGSGGGTPGTAGLTTTFSVEEMSAAREEAHAAGTHVAVHATSKEATRRAVHAQADVVEHAILISPHGDVSFDPRLADQMVRQGTVISPTLPTLLPPIRALERAEAAGGLGPSQQAQIEAYRRRLYWKVRHCVMLAQHGVRVANSTDAGWDSASFDNFADGLELMVAAGVSSRDAFRAATQTPARALGQSSSLGHLRPGARGDAVVVRGNPLSDIGAVRDVAGVYVGGRRVA